MKLPWPAIAVVMAIACGSPESPQQAETPVPPEQPSPVATKTLVVELAARSGSSLSGTATFGETGGAVTMTVSVAGVEPGEHAVHLHEIGDCSAEDATSAGGHWNPTATEHGRWGEAPYHRGDIGNLVVAPDGTGTLIFTADPWTIGGDPETDIVGRAVIVHAAADDFTTQPTGAAGGRIGCGVIARAEAP